MTIGNNIIMKYRKKNIAVNIKEYRLKQGLKQKDFANLLEMHPQSYSKMERGVYTPSVGKLIEICSILRATPNDLLVDTVRKY